MRCKQDGIEIDGELQADGPVFEAESTEVWHHYKLDMFVAVFWVLAQMRPCGLGFDERVRMRTLRVKCLVVGYD